MVDRSRYVAGEGPLTYERALREAWGMFRQHYWRVALVALILFVPPQVLAAALRATRDALEAAQGPVQGMGLVVGLLVTLLFRLAGPVVYAGYLDEAVGHEYFRGHRIHFQTVLRTLPWGRLIVADLVVVMGTVVGLSLLVVPGLVWLTLFGLVGPVIVQERLGLVDGFTRTLELSRRGWRLIVVLVVALIAFEQVVHEGVHQAMHAHDLWLEITATWLVSAVVGGFVGLVEVALATELMARHPRKPMAVPRA